MSQDIHLYVMHLTFSLCTMLQIFLPLKSLEGLSLVGLAHQDRLAGSLVTALA